VTIRGWVGSLTVGLALIITMSCGSDAPADTASPSSEATTTSSVQYTMTVTAHAGPTCPVERPDEPCPDVPVEATVRVSANGVDVATGRTDATGTYSADLPPGRYRVTVDTGSMLPRCEPVDAEVIDRDITVDVSCDTGIR